MEYDDEPESEITQPVVTIKRGKDPEVQEVDIACRQQNGAFSADFKAWMVQSFITNCATVYVVSMLRLL